MNQICKCSYCFECLLRIVDDSSIRHLLHLLWNGVNKCQQAWFEAPALTDASSVSRGFDAHEADIIQSSICILSSGASSHRLATHKLVSHLLVPASQSYGNVLFCAPILAMLPLHVQRRLLRLLIAIPHVWPRYESVELLIVYLQSSVCNTWLRALANDALDTLKGSYRTIGAELDEFGANDERGLRSRLTERMANIERLCENARDSDRYASRKRRRRVLSEDEQNDAAPNSEEASVEVSCNDDIYMDIASPEDLLHTAEGGEHVVDDGRIGEAVLSSGGGGARVGGAAGADAHRATPLDERNVRDCIRQGAVILTQWHDSQSTPNDDDNAARVGAELNALLAAVRAEHIDTIASTWQLHELGLQRLAALLPCLLSDELPYSRALPLVRGVFLSMGIDELLAQQLVLRCADRAPKAIVHGFMLPSIAKHRGAVPKSHLKVMQTLLTKRLDDALLHEFFATLFHRHVTRGDTLGNLLDADDAHADAPLYKCTVALLQLIYAVVRTPRHKLLPESIVDAILVALCAERELRNEVVFSRLVSNALANWPLRTRALRAQFIELLSIMKGPIASAALKKLRDEERA